MRYFMSLLMIVVYVAALECTANHISDTNLQIAEIANTDTTTTTEEPSTSTEEPSTSTEEPTTSTEEPTTLTNTTSKSATPLSGETNTGGQTSNKKTGSKAVGDTITGSLLTQKNVQEKVVAAVKSMEKKDDSRIGSATSFAFAAVVILGMLAIEQA